MGKYKTLLKEIKENLNKLKIVDINKSEKNINMVVLTKLIYGLNIFSIKISSNFL